MRNSYSNYPDNDTSTTKTTKQQIIGAKAARSEKL